MIYLVLCILLNCGLFVVFKYAGKHKTAAFPFLTINYIVAGSLGLIHHFLATPKQVLTAPQFSIAICAGIIFILVFNQMRITTQVNGLAVASIASKMSMIIPIIGTYFIFHEAISLSQAAGIILGLIAVYIISVSKENVVPLAKAPILLFFGAGCIDLFLKISETHILNSSYSALFTTTLFFSAGLCGLIYSLRTLPVKEVFNKINLKWGVIMGVVNYGALYFILKSLAHEDISSIMFFPINNIGIVVLSSLLGYALFMQKIDKRKKIGLALALCSILLIL